ncbi:DUF58 domain-containing protein [Bythopirellula goksoeyrii]|uniref:von Willebrand factor type A domain protein n=1 Tax=Bythopirellula goksoeyrii TaxID=1400387 RepID=A0A5B9QDM7_9BACT|nr:DUF58 domain-containing protein [Bythopirellula goksoeyrii]QEG37177.1 von Willebrand factor type A domain protein [Bythopirellula goksoeyrii]
MLPREIIKKIRRIQIHTTRIVDELLAGQWDSAFRGSGIEFEEVRPYQYGDDVRAIDWNVTARSGRPYIKLFKEEREVAVMLLVDQSASQGMGSHWQTKREQVTELGATLAFSAIKGNDRVGLTLFTDGIEKFVPPRKGTRHVLRIIRELLYCEPVGRGTNLTKALDHLNRTARRRSIVFLISDFQDSGYEKALKVARRKHDIIPVVVADEREVKMPNVGLVRLRDAETGRMVTFDTFSRANRRAYEEHARQKMEQRDALFRRLSLDPIHVYTGEDFVESLQKFFHRREKHR